MNITTLFQWAGLFLFSTFTAQISTGFAAGKAFTNPGHLNSGAFDSASGGVAAIPAGPMQPGKPEASRAMRPFDVLEQADGKLVADNPGQRWQVEFDGLGFTVSGPGTESDWGLELCSYGFGEARTTLQGKARVSSLANRVYYDREAGLSEWFVNDDRGVEQGWTFQQRPEGHAGGGELMLELAVRGGLSPRTLPYGSAVCFTDQTGKVKMTFGGLKAWDADGKALAVRFRHVKECPGRIRLTVEESLARYPITIDPLAQQAYLKASHLESQRLGWAVALSGQTVVVGAPIPTLSPQVGRAYVFERQNGIWAAQQTFAPVGGDTRDGDRFGWDLAISGDTVVIGAPESDLFRKPDAGGAYVYVRSGGLWAQKQLLRASNSGSDDSFGASVAIFNDTIVVGAPGEDNGARGVNGDQQHSFIYDAGAVYVFTRAGTTWTQQAYLKASNTDGRTNINLFDVRRQRFGGTVAISGNTILVGADGEFSTGTNSGAAYVFVRTTNSWSQQAMLKSPNPQPNRFFGHAIALSGNTAVVSELEQVHVFLRTNNQWAFRATLTNPDPSIGDNQDSFGSSVAVSGDQILVGDYKEESSATGLDGDCNNNSAPQAGAAYLYHWNGTNWALSTYLKASNTAEWDQFGWDVAMDGNLVAVGAPGESGLGLGVNPDQSSNTDPANTASWIGAAYVLGDSLLCQPVSDPAGSWQDSSGPLNVRLVFNERERLESGEVLHTPGLLGFNDAGQFAVIAAAECGSPSASSNNFMVRVNLTSEGPVKELSSFTPSPQRLYRGLGLRDDGGVLGFDLYDSADDPGPPGSSRVWNGGTFQHLPGGLLDLAEDDALGGTVVSRAVSANGNRYLVGVDQGGTVAAVVLDGQGATLRTFPGVIPFRGASPDYPGVGGQVAENGSFLGAPASSPGAVRLYRADGTSIPFGPTIEHARLSRDGTFVAYLDKPRSGNPALVIRSVLPAGAPVMTIIPPSQRDSEVDAFEGWLDQDGTRDIDVTEVNGGVSGFRDVLAIERLTWPLGDQIMTVVEALDTNGAPAFYYVRSSATSGKVFGSARLPRIPEAVYSTADNHSDNTTATLNRRGQVLLQEGLPLYDNQGVLVDRSLALSLFNANTFTKFKQTAYGQRLTGLAASPETRWFNQPVNPNLPAGSQKMFAAVGCTLTAMACISSLHGMEVTPLQVRDIMLGLGAINGNDTEVGQYRLTVGNKTLVRVNPIGGNFDTIVQELRDNHPVLLFVPNKGSSAVLVDKTSGGELQWPNGNYRFNSRGHYIVAWGINPSLPVGAPVHAQDILISDPAYQYSKIYAGAYTTPGEELVHVTLADYFNRIAADPVYSFDLLKWFNEGRFERMNEAEGTVDRIVLTQGDRDRQILRWRVMEGEVPPNPTVSVNSPVDLAISVAGKRYVSDASLAGPGDTVLQKDFSQNIGEYDEDNDSGLGADEPSEEFPPYTLALPPELAGVSLDFAIVGLASGSYTISLNPDKLGFVALNSLQGTIAAGVTNFGRITVEGTVNTNTLANWVAGYSGLGGNTGFSDDPDGDGIINGFECFFGTHPGQHSTGLTLMPGAPGATFRHPVNPTSAADLAAHYEWSPDLSSWHGSGTTIQGVSVTLTPEPSSTIPGSVEVVPMITGTPSMLFYRIRLERLGP